MKNFKLKCALSLIICSSVVSVFASACVRTAKCTDSAGTDSYYVCHGHASTPIWMEAKLEDINNHTYIADVNGWCNDSTVLEHGNHTLKTGCYAHEITGCKYTVRD